MAENPGRPPPNRNYRPTYRQHEPNHSHRPRFDRPTYRPPFDPNRPNYSKAFVNFGVSDLREYLNKKHQEEGQTRTSGPPPDPSFNYLKDPSREYEIEGNQYAQGPSNRSRNYHNNEFHQQPDHHSRPPREDYRGPNALPRGGRGRGRPQNGPSKSIQKPINIKVEFTTSTGEHKYTFDENTTLPDIRHMPDRRETGQRSFRGRGRGRGRGQPKTYPNNNYNKRKTGGRNFDQNVDRKNEQVATKTQELVSEENWDNECVGNNQTSDRGNTQENANVQQPEEQNEEISPEISGINEEELENYYEVDGDYEQQFDEENDNYEETEEAVGPLLDVNNEKGNGNLTVNKEIKEETFEKTNSAIEESPTEAKKSKEEIVEVFIPQVSNEEGNGNLTVNEEIGEETSRKNNTGIEKSPTETKKNKKECVEAFGPQVSNEEEENATENEEIWEEKPEKNNTEIEKSPIETKKNKEEIVKSKNEEEQYNKMNSVAEKAPEANKNKSKKNKKSPEETKPNKNDDSKNESTQKKSSVVKQEAEKSINKDKVPKKSEKKSVQFKDEETTKNIDPDTKVTSINIQEKAAIEENKGDDEINLEE